MKYKETTCFINLKQSRRATILEKPWRYQINLAYLKSETGDFWWDLRPENHLEVETKDPRPGTLKVGPKTWDTFFAWDLRPKTQDTERGIWDTYDRWDLRPKTNIPCQTWGARTMIQINLTKCPINRIWLIILLIFNHIVKATSKTWTQILDPDPEKPGTRKTWEIAGCRKKIGRPHTVKKRLVSKLTEKIVIEAFYENIE